MTSLILNPETEDARLIDLNQPSIVIGRSEDADVHIDSDELSDHHARIEQKPDGYYIISLQSGPGLLVNGKNVSFQRLKHGDKLQLGDVHAILQSDEETMIPSPAPQPGDPSMQHAPMPVAFPNAQAPMVTQLDRCPQCAYPVAPGTPTCPQCGTHLTNLPAMPMGYIPPMPAGQVGPGILPIIAFLAALTVVGAPVALVLGLMTLSIIRRRGGTPRDLSFARWAIGLGLVWLMLGAVGATGLVRQMQKRAQLDTAEIYEAKVIRALKNLACAQKYAHTIEMYDADEDGQGEYGSLAALTETKSLFFDPDLADGEAYGYLFAIREATEGQFLAVAEPAKYGVTGNQTFMIDQAGQIRGADSGGQRFSQIDSVLPALQGERSAYYEIDDEIAKDVLNYIKSLPSDLAEQEKKQRILARLRKDYALTTVGRELEGLEASVDRFVSEQHALAIYLAAQESRTHGSKDVALAKLMEIQEKHPSFSKIAAVERELMDLRSLISQQREHAAQDLFAQAEELERQGQQPQEVQRLYQRIETLYPDTDIATRITSLRPELERQLREHNAENIFSELMELSPERDFDKIQNLANQFRRNYKDTDLFSKVGTELTEKERKARASSWRVKTEQNIAAGRMRGALAQLESAARENQDLMYDLKDLYIQLYRSVAGTLVEEGDSRKALVYYERLSQLLQTSGSEETVSPDLLAELHNEVGQADYGLKAYKEARWHFSSASWKYLDDAPFNMRLGAANLYTGLYGPAETALTRSLTAREDMTSARLYRAYLNLRIVLAQERVLAAGLKQNESASDESSSDDSEDSQPEPANLIVSVDSVTEEDDEVTVNTSVTTGDGNVAGPQGLDVQHSDLQESWFSQFAGSDALKESTVPEPTDMDLFLSFNYYDSSSIITGFLQFLQDLDLQQIEIALAESTGRYNASNKNSGGTDARRMGRMQTKASTQRNISEFHTQLRQLRSFHLEDIDSRQELYDLMDEMKTRLRNATADLKTAGQQQPQILSLTEDMVKQIESKLAAFSMAERKISDSLQEETKMRERMMDLAEKMIKDNLSSSFKKKVAYYQDKLLDEDSSIEINPALRALRDSMNVRMNAETLLRAAEGNKAQTTSQM